MKSEVGAYSSYLRVR